MLELHYDLAALDAPAPPTRTILALLGLAAALVLGGLVTLLLGRTVVRRLDRVRAVANRLRDGDNTARTHLGGRDEIGALARDFDRMADALLEALKDPLTGLLNHRAFQERLAEELRRAERGGYPVSVVALDLDDFKAINGASGHAVGDEALRTVAAAMRDELRAGDVCGRVGGDEFMLALVDADVGTAELIVERIRDARRRPAAHVQRRHRPLPPPRHRAGRAAAPRRRRDVLGQVARQGAHVRLLGPIDFALSAEEAAERNLRAGLVNTVHALARAVDAKDGYTHSHSQRVARYAAELGRALGLPEERLELLRTAGVLHDVGKIGIPDAVLLKPAKLDDDEFAVMRRHSELGRDIIAGAGLEEIATWVLHLHERFDGRGYPDGLAGEEIPLESRILHCADALEAMTSSRIYRPGMAVERRSPSSSAAPARSSTRRSPRALVDLVRRAATCSQTVRAPDHVEHDLVGARADPVQAQVPPHALDRRTPSCSRRRRGSAGTRRRPRRRSATRTAWPSRSRAPGTRRWRTARRSCT